MMPGPVEGMISNRRGAARYWEYALSGHFTAGELLRLVTTERDHFRLVSAQKMVRLRRRDAQGITGRICPQAF